MSQVLALIASVLTLPGFYLYIRGIQRGTNRPHAFSWLVWSVLNAIAFVAQITNNGGDGSAILAVISAGTFSIFALSLSKGERSIKTIDWISLAGAAAAGIVWLLTDSPLTSVIMVTVIDAFGSFPTFRKTYVDPFGEPPQLYLLGVIAFVLSVIALKEVSLETALFPTFIAVSDSCLITMILLRRCTLTNAKSVSPAPN